MTPLVTVLMAVHNGKPYLSGTLDSVFAQGFTDFEFVIVDDASTDGSATLIDAARSDARVRVLRNERNMGLTRSLNLGLANARGRYVARIDADDACLPDRLSRQVAFLESTPDCIVAACGYHVIDGEGRHVRTVGAALDDWQIRWLGGFNPPAPHPTYFFRRLAPTGEPVFYDEAFRTAQDFDLWSRLSELGRTAVMPDVLVHYRRHAGAITVTKRREQAENCRIVGQRNLERRLPPAIAARLETLHGLFSYRLPATAENIAGAIAGCDAMLAHDLPLAPSDRHRRWVRRTAAGLLADAILSRGGALRSAAGLAAYLVYARRHHLKLAEAVLSEPTVALKSMRAVRSHI